MTVDVPPKSFERQVRDCLAHLYDFTELHTNPLASQMTPDLAGLERVQTGSAHPDRNGRAAKSAGDCRYSIAARTCLFFVADALC